MKVKVKSGDSGGNDCLWTKKSCVALLFLPTLERVLSSKSYRHMLHILSKRASTVGVSLQQSRSTPSGGVSPAGLLLRPAQRAGHYVALPPKLWFLEARWSDCPPDGPAEQSGTHGQRRDGAAFSLPSDTAVPCFSILQPRP